MVITRKSYQEKRFALLESMINVRESVGLEIGACDLPTVSARLGICYYADFRAADEMAKIWSIPRETICDVNFIIKRDKDIGFYIKEKFDYIVACHVIEHVPDPIGYINELKLLLKPGAGKVVFLAVPDKRETIDKYRPSTRIEHLLMNYSHKVRTPSLEHVIEFYRHRLSDQRGSSLLNIDEAFKFAVEHSKSDQVDAHCHVWTDEEFLNLCLELTKFGFLTGLSLARFQLTPQGFNEFVAVFST